MNCRSIAVIGSMVLIAACGEPEVAEEPVVPRVKLYTVGEADTERTRRFSGSVVASAEAPLSFPLSGTVAEVNVSAGTKVRQGQLLARLDPTPVRIVLDGARAQLASARASFQDAESTYNRYTSLGAKGAVSRADIETATANYASARSSVTAARAEIERLERDLANSNLTAPFDGTIAERSIEPFQEVTPGTPALVLQTSESLDVELQIPENMIAEVNYGDVVDVEFPALEGDAAKGSVVTIGSRAQTGNSFPISVRLYDAPDRVRPGMTAGVTFSLATQSAGNSVYLIPVSSIAIDVAVTREPGSTSAAPVFVFDAASGTLAVRDVIIGEIRGNFLEVLGGLEEGDRVVSAGVPFLRDGQAVEEWTPGQGLDNG